MQTDQLDPLAMLDAAAAGAAPAKGKKKAALVWQSQTAADLIRQYLDTKRQLESLQGLATTIEDQIAAEGKRARLELCRRHNRLEASVVVTGTKPDDPSVRVEQQCSYSAIDPAAHGEALREMNEAFGPEAYAQYFADERSIEVREQFVSDRAFLQRLMAAFGAEFSTYFAVKKVVKPTETFHSDYTLKPEVQAKADPFVQRDVIKPRKASVKLK